MSLALGKTFIGAPEEPTSSPAAAGGILSEQAGALEGMSWLCAAGDAVISTATEPEASISIRISVAP